MGMGVGLWVLYGMKQGESECMCCDTNLVESNTMCIGDIDRQGRVECVQHELSKVLEKVCATVFPRLCCVCVR